MIPVPDIRDERSRVCEWGCCERASEEAEDEDGRRVFGQCAADLEARVDEESADEEGPAAVRLGERTPEEWTDAVPRDEEGDGQNSDFLGEAKLLFHVRNDTAG